MRKRIKKIIMKKTATILDIMLISKSFSQTNNLKAQVINPFSLDKITHVLAGGFITYMAYHAIDDKKKAFTKSFFIGVGAGLVKETIDLAQGKPFNWADVRFTAFGALMGTVSFKVVTNFKHKAKGDNSDFENIGPVKENMFSCPVDTLTTN